MILSIITINLNNSSGLEKTMKSVLDQTRTDFEYIVVDGASTDGSVDVITQFSKLFGKRLKWVSEPDKGIYNAMNKGIGIASGEYIEFLNSGDCLVSADVVYKMNMALENNAYPSILYGNMLKDMTDGSILRDRCFAGQDISFLGFFMGTLNHSSAFIQKRLFQVYGLYDESLKIVSDWKWYMQAIVFGGEKPVYIDLDVTSFDMHGISETNKELDKIERKQVLEQLINPNILIDYVKWASAIEQMKRLKRHPFAFWIVWLIERCLFKVEKYQQKRKNEAFFQQ